MEKDKTRRDCAYKDFPNKQTNMIAYRHSVTTASACAWRPSPPAACERIAPAQTPTPQHAPASPPRRRARLLNPYVCGENPPRRGRYRVSTEPPARLHLSPESSRIPSLAIYFHQKASTLSIRYYVLSDRCELSTASPFHGVQRLLGLGLHE